LSAGTAALVTNDEAQEVPAMTGTAELFTVLRGKPLVGRGFVQGDDAPGAPAIVVIGHSLWQRRFGGAPTALGSVVTINDRSATIVGVMPRGFGHGNPDTELWLPMTIDRARAEQGGRTLSVLGRLADGATFDRARSEMAGIAERMARTSPDSHSGWGVTLVPWNRRLSVRPCDAR
jgi:hypothetical protein